MKSIIVRNPSSATLYPIAVRKSGSWSRGGAWEAAPVPVELPGGAWEAVPVPVGNHPRALELGVVKWPSVECTSRRRPCLGSGRNTDTFPSALVTELLHTHTHTHNHMHLIKSHIYLNKIHSAVCKT